MGQWWDQASNSLFSLPPLSLRGLEVLATSAGRKRKLGPGCHARGGHQHRNEALPVNMAQRATWLAVKK